MKTGNFVCLDQTIGACVYLHVWGSQLWSRRLDVKPWWEGVCGPTGVWQAGCKGGGGG